MRLFLPLTTCLCLLLAGCGQDAEQQSGQAPEDSEIEQAVADDRGSTRDDGSMVVTVERELKLAPVEVREEEPAVRVSIDPAEVIVGQAMRTEAGPGGTSVDLLKAEIEGDELVVALRYRNETNRSVAIPISMDEISYTVGDVTQSPGSEGVRPDKDSLEIEPDGDSVLQIRFVAPPPDTGEISLRVGNTRFETVPINWAN